MLCLHQLERSSSVPGSDLPPVPAEASPGSVLTILPLQPTPCPRSVAATAKADPTFGELFQFDIPVLMWDQHFNPETWDRLKARRVPYGWQGLSQAGMGHGGLKGTLTEGARDGETPQRSWGSRSVPTPREQRGGGDSFANATLQHLVTFSPNKSSSVCMMMN